MRARTQNRDGDVPRPLDGVQLAVINNRLQAIVRKMANTLFRTARSGVINSAKDFSCCLLRANDELLAAADSLPIHVMVGPDLVARYMREWHPQLRRGDAFLHNSPYHGNSHAGDHSLLAPVVDKAGIHRFTVYVKAHVADCGNSIPTTVMMEATDVYNEGALIFPCVKVQENYQHIDDVIRMCMQRIRAPEMWWGDYLGMLGAVRIGEREVLRVGEELGWGVLDNYAQEWFDYSEARMVSAIRQLPSGTATVRNQHDPVTGVTDSVPVVARVEIDTESAQIEVDLTRSADAVPCGINLTEATARTAALIGLFNSIDHHVPKNAGSFRRVRVHLRKGCVAGIPVHPSSCSAATTGVADRVANAVQRAMAEIAEGAGMAEGGSSAVGRVISGRDPRRRNEPFINMIFFPTGGAGNPYTDGWLTLCHVGNGGMMLRDSVEIDEYLYPIRIERNEIVQDSEGAGRLRGTAANLVEFTPVACSMDVVWSSDGTVHPAVGVRGGLPGSPHALFVRKPDGELVELPGSGRVRVGAGDVVVSRSPSGGGYGSPLERDPERVWEDVREGWISHDRAESVYGVCFLSDGSLDLDATLRLRSERADRLD